MVVNNPKHRNRAIAVAVTVTVTVAGGLTLGKQACTPPLPPEPPPPTTDASPEPDAPAPECHFVGPRSSLLAKKTRRVPRIVGGTTAPAGAYPFAAGIATPSRFQYCGGSVIAPRFVLTAAHCQVEAGDLVLVGSNDLTKARAVRVAESRINSKFNDSTLDYDVAVARLEQDAGVPALALATLALLPNATVIGWGATSEGGSATTLLQQVSVPLWSADDCRSVYPELTARQICAGRVEGGADSCQGDSGGSLLTGSVGDWRALGIVSYGIGCARPGVPGVYTDIRNSEISAWVGACIK
jgi:secreted trypsin-like serine protease